MMSDVVLAGEGSLAYTSWARYHRLTKSGNATANFVVIVASWTVYTSWRTAKRRIRNLSRQLLFLSTSMPKHILPHALAVPAIKKLAGKRIVLASNNPRRREILRTFVRVHTFGCDSQLIALAGSYLRPLRVLNLTSCHRPLRKTCL